MGLAWLALTIRRMTLYMMMMLVVVTAAALRLVVVMFMTTAALVFLLLALMPAAALILVIMVLMIIIATATVILVVVMMLVTMLMGMHSAVSMAMSRNMPHAAVVVILATVATGAAFRTITIILGPFNMAIHMSKAPNLAGAIAYIL